MESAVSAQELLGGGEIFVAWLESFLDAWTRLGAIGESRDGLRAADAGDFRDTKKARGGEQFGIWLRAKGDVARNTRNFDEVTSHVPTIGHDRTTARVQATSSVERANEPTTFHTTLR